MYSRYSSRNRMPKNPLAWLGIFLLVCAVVGGLGYGVYFLAMHFKNKEEENSGGGAPASSTTTTSGDESSEGGSQEGGEEQEETGFDAIIYNSISNMYYFIKDNEVWEKPYGSSKTASRAGTLSSVFGGLTLDDGEKLDAALFNGDSEKYYFFSDDKYWSKDYGSDETISEEKTIAGNWEGVLPDKIDAAVYNRNTNKYYFFSGDEVWRKESGEDSAKLGKTKDHFGEFEVPEGGIEGALYNHDDSIYYFFNKDKYWRKDKGNDEKISTRLDIEGNWGGLYDLRAEYKEF